jgi:hypothetical protein
VLPEYHGLGFSNLAPTALRHFGVESGLSGLSPEVLPGELLAGAERIVTLLIDALGYEQLLRAMERGLAPRLSALAARQDARLAALTSTFPSTTVTALTTLGTGLPPGEHGVVSQRMYDASLGAVIDVLRFTPAYAGRSLEQAGLEPAEWIGLPTVYERLRGAGVRPVIVNHSQFEGTSLSRINHRDAEYVGFRTISDLAVNLRAAIEAADGPAYIHAYWGTLDTLAHEYGAASPQHDAEVRVLDYALGEVLLGGLRAPGTLLLLFADHGHIDTTQGTELWLNDHPELLGLLAAPPAGLTRAAILYVRPGRETEAREYAEARLGECAEVLTAEESVWLGLYGPGALSAVAEQRIGQLLLLPRGNWTIKSHLPGEERRPSPMVGKHGGLSPQEMLVPLLAARL